MGRAGFVLGAAVCALSAAAALADVPYVVVGGRGIGICALGPLNGSTNSDLLDSVLGAVNVDDPASIPTPVEGDCRPGSLWAVSSTTIADPIPPNPLGPPTPIVFDLRTTGVVDGRSRFDVPGQSLLSSVAPARDTDFVTWILPFDPTAGGSFESPQYDWAGATDGGGAANISGSIVTAYTDDTEPTPDGSGSIVSRVPPSMSSAIGAVRIELPLLLTVYSAADRCLLEAGNPSGCVDPFSSGYSGGFDLQTLNETSEEVFGQPTPLHTVQSGAPVLGVLPFSLDLVSVAATSRVFNSGEPLGGFTTTLRLADPMDPRGVVVVDPFGTGELAGVAAGAVLNGDLQTDLNGDQQPDVDEVHFQYVAELGFKPLSLLQVPPLPSPLPMEPSTDDADGDGVVDEEDNCPNVPNDEQLDADENEIGDACQCGDVDGNGLTNVVDALRIARGEVPSADPNFGKCDVSGDGECNTVDALQIARGEVGSSPAEQLCPTYLGL